MLGGLEEHEHVEVGRVAHLARAEAAETDDGEPHARGRVGRDRDLQAGLAERGELAGHGQRVGRLLLLMRRGQK